MVVRIWNITDAPGKKAREVRIYNKRIRPGQHLTVPAQFVDAKVRKLEDGGFIAIGQVPPWYDDYKSKRIEADEINARVKALADYKAARAPKPTPDPVPQAAPEVLVMEEAVEPADEMKAESQEGRPKRKKRR